MESLLGLPRLSIEGLMTIPPEKEFDLKLPQLSMGMTTDFRVATEEGATLVRVGTAIFGERSKKQKNKATDEHGFSRISEL